MLGGHSTLSTGITKVDGKLYLENLESWGKDKGANGKFLIPESYVTGGHIMDVFIGHNGPPIGPSESDCTVGTGTASLLSSVSKLLRRRGRFKYFNP